MKGKLDALKRISVAALMQDKHGRILVLDPERKDGWLLPGGIAERGEPPRAACQRAVNDELGIDIPLPGHPSLIDYRGNHEEYIMFVFDCGTLDDETIARIKFPAEYYHEFRFATKEEARKMLRPNSVRRLDPLFAAIESGSISYLENGIPF